MSETVFMFAGQGAQEIGMGVNVAEEYEVAREVFDRAADTIDVDLLAICREGPEDELARTDICQPAILTVSIALLRAFESETGDARPLAAAGLSLGEYSALVAAGVIPFEQAVKLTRARGQYMQQACEANPGTMCSVIGLEAEEVHTACTEVRDSGGQVWPANYNSPSQVVISGESDAVTQAAELCDERGARRTIGLNVAGAFHTPLMQPAAEKLAEKLDDIDLSAPEFPVLANVTGSPAEKAGEIRDLLKRQVTSPVRWNESMQWCRERGGERFYEFGPGRVLRGLLRRIDRGASCRSVNDLHSLRSASEEF
ncbi:MAG: ACP S-malonyltransferase [Planctomycetota bacterium]